MGVRYMHYSKEPLGTIRDSGPQPAPGEMRPGVGPLKPVGLWFSVDGGRGGRGGRGGWAEWCRRSGYRVDGLACRTELALDLRRFAVVSDYAGLAGFHRRYRAAPPSPGGELRSIDWRRVAADWGGVVIAPYVREARLEYHWYYGWDCASGCVWDAGSVSVGRRGRGVKLRSPRGGDAAVVT